MERLQTTRSLITENDLLQESRVLFPEPTAFDKLLEKLERISKENAQLNNTFNILLVNQCKFLEYFEEDFENDEDQPSKRMKHYIDCARFMADNFNRRNHIIDRVKKRLKALPF